MIDFLKQSWVIIVAIIGGVTLIWNFVKTFKDIKTEITKPITNINIKIDNLSKDLNGKIDKLSEKVDKAEESDTKVRGALLTMQRSSLLRSCEDFMKRGFATLNEKDTISKQYDSYHELGGDQFITDLVKGVMDLPLEKQTKAKKKLDNN